MWAVVEEYDSSKVRVVNWEKLSKACLLGFFSGPFVFRDKGAPFLWV